MALFQRAINTQAYLKAGIMGFAGDGKTYTASELAIGLVMLMRQRGIEAGNRPVMFLDTETGSDWVNPALMRKISNYLRQKPARLLICLKPLMKRKAAVP
ncbi:hypothetical protein QK891_01075 [Escherichia coli]|uniref:hypothetical protein n=1 Tax=Escherichia coli TaxID=562 RepID=UPI00397756E8